MRQDHTDAHAHAHADTCVGDSKDCSLRLNIDHKESVKGFKQNHNNRDIGGDNQSDTNIYRNTMRDKANIPSFKSGTLSSKIHPLRQHNPALITQEIPNLSPPSSYSSSDELELKIPSSSFSTKLQITQDGTRTEARTLIHDVSTEGSRLVRSDLNSSSVNKNDDYKNHGIIDDDDDDDDGNNNSDDNDTRHDDNVEAEGQGQESSCRYKRVDAICNENGDNSENIDNDGDNNDPECWNDKRVPISRIISNFLSTGMYMGGRSEVKERTISESKQIEDRQKCYSCNNLPKVCFLL